jgi:hypothetical protein
VDLLVQDLIVTTIAAAAACVLITRVKGVVSSSRKRSSCEQCANCDDRAGASLNSQART